MSKQQLVITGVYTFILWSTLLLLLYGLLRLLFLLYNLPFFQPLNYQELFASFLYGIRFDYAVVFYCNLPILIALLIPWENKAFRLAIRILFILINAVLLIPNFLDLSYFAYTNKRTGAELLSLFFVSQDVFSMLGGMLMEYGFIVLLWLFGLYLLYQISGTRIMFKQSFSRLPLACHYLLLLLFLFFTAGIVRGFKLKPLHMMTAASYVSPQYMPLILNSAYTFLSTLDKEPLPAFSFYSDEKLNELYSPIKHYNSDVQQEKNVMVIILEGFSTEYIGALNEKGISYTPFLDSLVQQSLSFRYAMANGRKSIDALPSIFASIPALMDEPYSTSSYGNNQVDALPKTLKKQGYHTSFFHGGQNGTMGFDLFSRMIGIDHYFGLNEYNKSKPGHNDHDGHWGIYDKPYLQYYAEQLDLLPEPFFSAVFTLTSHHPFPIPDAYAEQFPEEQLPIHRTVRYSDYALQQFFQRIRQTEWYARTLFVVTADHTGPSNTREGRNAFGRYHVPMFFYAPSDINLLGSKEQVVQHLDIYPSVVDYLGLSTAFVSFGSSVFTEESFAIQYVDHTYQLVMQDTLMHFDGENAVAYYAIKEDPLMQHPYYKDKEACKQEAFVKAFLQSYSTRLIHNKQAIQAD